jgi:mRNA interferase MazF
VGRDDHQRRESRVAGRCAAGEQYREAGLPAASVIRPCKLATIEARHAEPLGHITPALLRDVKGALRNYFDFQ